MNTVLGLSVTQSRVGWVLINAAEGPSLDDDAFDVGDRDMVADRAAAAARGAQAIAAASGHEIRSIGVTWCGRVDAEVNELLALLKNAGCDDVRTVPPDAAVEPDCDALDPVEQAYRAADAVATDAVPKVCAIGPKPRSCRSPALKFVAATAGVIAALGVGTQFMTRDAQPAPEPSAQPIGVPQIVSAHVPLNPTHPATAVRPTAKKRAEPTYPYSYSRPEPVGTPVSEAGVAAQAAAPSARAESPVAVPEPAPTATAHLPASGPPGPVAPGPAMPVSQTLPVAGPPAMPAQSVQGQPTPVEAAPPQPAAVQAQPLAVQPAATQPAAAQPAATQPAAAQPAATQPAPPQPEVLVDPLAGLWSALP